MATRIDPLNLRLRPDYRSKVVRFQMVLEMAGAAGFQFRFGYGKDFGKAEQKNCKGWEDKIIFCKLTNLGGFAGDRGFYTSDQKRKSTEAAADLLTFAALILPFSLVTCTIYGSLT